MLSLNLSPFPVITTDRLVLRRISVDDGPEIFALRSDERVMKYIERPRAKTIQDAVELIEKINTMIDNNDGINWAITLKGEDRLIGMISYHKVDKENYRAELGYLLNPDYQRKGIMQEAISSVLKFGFEKLNFHSIEALINPENFASQQILEKNGFVREAYFRENFFWNGNFLDTGVYSLLYAGFQKHNK